MFMYAYAYGARSHNDQGSSQITSCGATLAKNDAEATGRAIQGAIERWPHEEGYTDHFGIAMRIDLDIFASALREMLANLDSTKE